MIKIQNFNGKHSNELLTLVTKLIERYQPLQIFSFGHTMTEVSSTSCFSRTLPREEHQYFLFMITESNTRIVHDVQDYINKHFSFGIVSILCHGEENVRDAIKNNSRFFNTIMNEGTLLYSRTDTSLFIKEVDYDYRTAIENAGKQIAGRLPLIEGFLSAAQHSIENKKTNVGLFLLHQTVEQSTILLVRIYTGYRTELHNLKRQLQLCNCFSLAPCHHFLSGGPEDERLFDVLMNGYSASRYDDGYSIKISDVEALFIKVSSFYNMVKLMCNQHLAFLNNDLKQCE